MGRKPEGERALTGAERQARYRAAQEALRRAGDGETAAELAQARARIAALERETTVLRQENATLRQHKKQAAPPPSKPPADDDAEKAKLRAEVKQLRKTLAGYRRQFKHIAEAPKGALVISARDRRKILGLLHPDNSTDPAKQKRLTEAFQFFGNLSMVEVEPVE